MIKYRPYQQRVVDEAAELFLKLDSLTKFKTTPSYTKLSLVDQNLLQEQWMSMTDYLDILQLRIDRFKLETPHNP